MPIRGRSRPSPKFRLTTPPPSLVDAACADGCGGGGGFSRPLCYAAAVALVTVVAIAASGDYGAGTGAGGGGGFRATTTTTDGNGQQQQQQQQQQRAEGDKEVRWEQIDGMYGFLYEPRDDQSADDYRQQRHKDFDPSRLSSSSSSSSTASSADEPKGGAAAEKMESTRKHGDAKPSSGTTSTSTSDSTKTSSPPLFHQVYTTGDQYLSTINVRSMESIFFVHPDAKLRLYYNEDTKFSRDAPRLKPLLDHGYDITLVPYDPKDALEEAVRMSEGHEQAVDERLADEFIGRLDVLKREKFWFSNEANLLRLCLLYTVGGTYLDTDVVLVKPLDDVDDAVAGGAKGKSIHCAVLRFTRPGNVYLSAAITNFLANYDGTKWGNNGPSAFRRTVEEHPELVCGGEVGAGREVSAGSRGKRRPDCWVNILPAETFAPVRWKDWRGVCSEPGSSPVGREAEDLMKGSYAVHLNNQVTGPLLRDVGYVEGSLCDLVLSKYCSVCS